MSFKERIERASVSLVRAAIGGAIAALTGAGAVVNQDGNRALGTALLIGAGAGILRLAQSYAPGLTFGAILNRLGFGAFTSTVDSFARAYTSAIIVYAYGVVTSPDTTWTRAALAAAITAGFTAALRAGEAAVSSGK